MVISITTNDGILLEKIDEVEDYNLEGGTGRGALAMDIKSAIDRAVRRGDLPANEVPAYAVDGQSGGPGNGARPNSEKESKP